MKLKKYIAFLLLSIYTMVLFHDIIPHHHHDNVVVFGFDTSCCENHSHLSNGHNHDEHSHSHTCSEINFENNCSCNITHEHSHKHSDKHANCETFKVQLSKLFAISFYFTYTFEQDFSTPKIFFADQDNPEIIDQSPIRRRGPPTYV